MILTPDRLEQSPLLVATYPHVRSHHAHLQGGVYLLEYVLGLLQVVVVAQIESHHPALIVEQMEPPQVDLYHVLDLPLIEVTAHIE